MVARPEGHEVGVVGRGRVGHAPRAADVGVAELVSQTLEFVGRELVVIPENVIM